MEEYFNFESTTESPTGTLSANYNTVLLSTNQLLSDVFRRKPDIKDIRYNSINYSFNYDNSSNMSIFTFNFPNTFQQIYSVYFSFINSYISLSYCGWIQMFQPMSVGYYGDSSYRFGSGMALMGNEANLQRLSSNIRFYITNSSVVFKANDNFSSYVSPSISGVMTLWLCVV